MTLAAFRRKLLLQYLATVGVLLALGMGAIWWLTGTAGLRELDLALESEINKLAAAVQVDAKQPGIDGKKSLERARPGSQAISWQVLADGRNLLKSKSNDHTDSLPEIGAASAARSRSGRASCSRAGR